MPGGYANDDPIQWTNEGYLAPWLNRVANTVKFSPLRPCSPPPGDGIYLDDEADQSFDLDFVMAHQGLTEAQARQAVFNVGKRFAQAIVNNWNTARVGHEPWIMAYAMDVMVGSWVAQTQIDVNDADPDWADRLMYREFLAGMGQVDGFIWHDISALYYRHPQGNWHDGVHSGALDGSDAAVRYAAGRQVSNFRTAIANYSDPSDPFNAFRVFAHPENFGSCGYAWWDGNQSPESFPHPNQSAAAAGVEATAMADFMEGVTAVFFYSTFDPDLDLRTYTTAIQAYDAG
jgi:hypothetical protein